MNILVAVDYSPNSLVAAQFAAFMTAERNATLHLLHALTPQHEEDQYLPVRTLQARKNTVFEMFSLQETLRRNFNVVSSSELIAAELPSSIDRAARRAGASMTVVGQQGESGLKKHLFGSTTVDVLLQHGLPVMVVPSQAAIKVPSQVVFVTAGDSAGRGEAILPLLPAMNSLQSLIAAPGYSVESDNVRRISPHTFLEDSRSFLATHRADVVVFDRLNPETIMKLSGRSLESDFLFSVPLPMLFL